MSLSCSPDQVLEKAMHKCVLKPLKNVIVKALQDFQVSDELNLLLGFSTVHAIIIHQVPTLTRKGYILRRGDEGALKVSGPSW